MPGGPPISLRGLTLGVLTALLAVQAARLVWILVTPLGPFGAAPAHAEPPTAVPLVLSRFDPFYRGAATAAPSDVGGFRLFGVRTGASAILAGPDGRQAAFAVGEEIAPGVRLQSAGFDEVVLDVAGRHTTLRFGPREAGEAYVPSPTPVRTDVPHPVPNGFVLPSGGPGAESLVQAGLNPGDVVVAIDGQSVAGAGAESLNALRRRVAEGGTIDVQFQRDGQLRTAVVGSPAR